MLDRMTAAADIDLDALLDKLAHLAKRTIPRASEVSVTLVQGGNATTIPSEAGGICQVVTTLFHPLFWIGVPFTERHHHSYWIEKYGLAPMGMKGLDATIDPPWSDLKFKNTTGNWLVISVERLPTRSSMALCR